jgi:hypothetical protein
VAHHERNQPPAVLPELVEWLDQAFIAYHSSSGPIMTAALRQKIISALAMACRDEREGKCPRHGTKTAAS